MKKIKWYILFIVMIFTLSGCRAQRNQTVKFEKKDKAPKALGDISKGLQDILKETEKVESILEGTDYDVNKVELERARAEEKAKIEKTIEIKNETGGAMGTQGDSGGNQGKGGGSQGSQGGQPGDQSQGAKSKEQKKPEGREEKLLSTWEQIDKKIEETHKKWNEYEVEGVKKGVTLERTEKFKESLNALTKSIEDRTVAGIYNYGSQSMSNLAPMFEIYKDEIWGEINKIKYSTYQSYLKALEGKDIEASSMLGNLEEETNKIRLKLEKNDSKIKMLDNINLAIIDMKNALNEKSIKLTKIKKDIIIKNLEKLGE
ncbi:hypothetical protein CIW83_20920 [Tissierella sp. P1]|uniref:hypothetical protein n=1 Tax=Tissierella TaxID=41273 RepID=UPI000BA0EA21|nr:hypothetical protein [Tissierella sp. P1]OZV10324.1 hypothetical protein CIW83_20920 [Tissierella sp. P1]